MEIKIIPPINFLFFRTVCTIDQLVNYLPIGQELFKEAVTNQLKITGPVHWHYHDFTGAPDKPFTLEIALPVSAFTANYDGQYHVKRTEDFRCVTTLHEGSWLDIPSTYGKLMEFCASQNLILTNMNREIYVNVDFDNAAANVTQIQLGIA